MGYKTVMNCPYVSGYDKAVEIFNKAIPIKGRSPELRPFGARRDADMYSIAMVDSDVHIRLASVGRTAIAFHPDNTVTLSLFWGGTDCNQLFAKVLGINAYIENRNSVIEVNGVKYVYKESIKLKIDGADVDNKYTVLNPMQVGDWKLDIKKANEIRKLYSPYLTFVRNMCKLRKETLGDSPVSNEEVIAISFEEVDMYFARQTEIGMRTKHNIDEYALAFTYGDSGHLDRFMSLVKSDKNEDWHKAMCILARVRHHYGARHCYNIPPDALMEMSKKAMYRHHRTECIKWVVLPPGKVPEGKYNSWMAGITPANFSERT